MKTKFSKISLYGLLILFFFSACSSDDDVVPNPLPENEVCGRTILAYIWGDVDGHIELSSSQLLYINKLEAGWDDNFDGELYVYLEPSPSFIQFKNPVILKISHDKSLAINSQVIKEFKPVESHQGDYERYVEVQKYIREIAPAKSNGLMIFGHGNAWMPFGDLSYEMKKTRGMGGNSTRYMEIKEMVQNTLDNYDFILFHACQMANIETFYEFRKKAHYLVGSEINLLSYGYPWDITLPYLYTFPNPDLSSFINEAYNYQHSLEAAVTITLVDATRMEMLAQETKKIFKTHHVTNAQLLGNFSKYHFVFNEDEEEELSPDLGINESLLNSLSFYQDFKQAMAVNSLNTLEWEKAFHQTVLLHGAYLGEYHDEMESMINDKIIPYYNGLSIYMPCIFDKIESPDHNFMEYFNRLAQYYKTLDWYTDSGFANLPEE